LGDERPYDLIDEINSLCLPENVQLRYFISPDRVSEQTALENNIKQMYGSIDADYEFGSDCYSEWTGCIERYDTILMCGDHDLYNELSKHQGEYLILILNY